MKHIVGFSVLALIKTPVVHPTCIDLVLLTLVLSGFFFCSSDLTLSEKAGSLLKRYAKEMKSQALRCYETLHDKRISEE